MKIGAAGCADRALRPHVQREWRGVEFPITSCEQKEHIVRLGVMKKNLGRAGLGRKANLTATLLLLIFPLLLFPQICLAQHEQALPLLPKDGVNPGGGLISDSAGNFYGTGGSGGANNLGTVFQLSPVSNGMTTLTVLYSFTGSGDGAYPVGDLVFDSSGNIYGVTQFGGNLNSACSSMGCGTVFELSPPIQPGGPWTETVLYKFQGSPDGAEPGSGLVLDGFGSLYGTTKFGGAQCSCGTVFEISPTTMDGWTETVLYLFGNNPDGSEPTASPVFDSAGNLYGTTSLGGQWGAGTVFQLAPPSQPGGPWTEVVLHSLFANTDGRTPTGGLTLNGSAIYGTASEDGPNGHGTVFRLFPSRNASGAWTFELVHSFGGLDGSGPGGRLTFANPNTLYGTTEGGGSANSGTVFQISNSQGKVTETVLYTFAGGLDGSHPSAGLILLNFALYSTTPIGGKNNGGVVFRLSH